MWLSHISVASSLEVLCSAICLAECFCSHFTIIHITILCVSHVFFSTAYIDASINNHAAVFWPQGRMVDLLGHGGMCYGYDTLWI